MSDDDWTRESNVVYHGHPFRFLLAAGDTPSRVVDKNHRVVATVEPIYEDVGHLIAQRLNEYAALRRADERDSVLRRNLNRLAPDEEEREVEASLIEPELIQGGHGDPNPGAVHAVMQGS